MSKFLTKNSKLVYMIFGVLMGLVIISALCYMTQYTHIHVFYVVDGNSITFLGDTEGPSGKSNQNLVDFFANTADTTFNKDFLTEYGQTVIDYQLSMSSFNNLIVAFGIVGLVCFALLLILGNHNRRIYYKSNLYGGIALPLIPAVFSIIMIVKNTLLMGTFNKNKELFNRVSVLQDPNYIDSDNFYCEVDYLKERYTCNDITYIIYNVIFGIVLIYSLFLIVTAVMKYKNTAADRARVLEKAVKNND